MCGVEIKSIDDVVVYVSSVDISVNVLPAG